MCNVYRPPGHATVEHVWHLRSGQHWPEVVHPRAMGPFIRKGMLAKGQQHELVVGQWALIPPWADGPRLNFHTNNARAEEVAGKASFRDAWRRGQRCIIAADSFDEPCWESGRNVWWRFHRTDGQPWALAGLWNAWTDGSTGEVFESYTMLTLNADAHPLMRRMHKPDPKLPPGQQDKRSVVPIALEDVDRWLCGTVDDAQQLLRLAPLETFHAGPVA